MATAVTVLYNAFVSINAVDRSEQVDSVSLPMTVAELDATCMGSDTTVHEPGLKGFSLDIGLKSDFTDDEDDEDFHALWDARTKFAVLIRPSATAVGVGNPSYAFTGFISSWNAIQGSVGELSTTPMTITNTSALVRAVT